MKEVEKIDKLEISSTNNHHLSIVSNANLQNETSHPESNTILHSQLQRLKKDYLLEFVEILRHKAVKQIDVSNKVK